MYSSYYGGKGKYKIDQWNFQIAENSLSLSLFFFPPSVQFICSVVSYYVWSHWLQHSRFPCPSPIPGACSNSCPSSQKFYSAILCIPGIQQELILSHYLVNTQWGKSLSHVRPLWPHERSLPGSSFQEEDFPGKNTGAGCHFLLQGIFPIQGSNLGLLHCRQARYHLNHQGSKHSGET